MNGKVKKKTNAIWYIGRETRREAAGTIKYGSFSEAQEEVKWESCCSREDESVGHDDHCDLMVHDLQEYAGEFHMNPQVQEGSMVEVKGVQEIYC
jgi:hypothetical protein